MAWRIVFPSLVAGATDGPQGKVVVCRIENDGEALNAAERILGFEAIGLAVVQSEFDDERAANMGIAEGSCVFVSADSLDSLSS